MTSRNEGNVESTGRGLRALGLCAALAALGVSAIAGCAMDGTGGESASASGAQAAAPVHVDGEALIRGLFFGQGEVAARLPELWEKPAAEGVESTKIEDAIARARASGPTAIDDFAREITSGDVVRVRAAAEDMAKRLVEKSLEGGHSSEEMKAIIIFVPAMWVYTPIVVYLDPRVGPIWARNGLSEDTITAIIADHLAAQ
jgi:hypothetical protein